MKKYMKFLLVPFVIVVGIVLTGCTEDDSTKKAGENALAEQKAVSTGFSKLSDSQQIPSFPWSQARQTLIDVETFQATGASSTTAGYLEGVGLIWWCPSIGTPVASTSQLSASQQYVDLKGDNTAEQFPIDQGEPIGYYPGQSSGTYTICLDDNGKKFLKYWEGYVDSTGGAINTYPAEKRVRPTDVTFEFTEEPSE